MHASRGCAHAARLAIIIATLAPAVAAASPLELFGYGGRSPGMAGTGVASSDDYESLYLNPAGLARTPGRRGTLGWLEGDFSLSMNGEDTGTENAAGLVSAVGFPLPLGGSMKDRVGLGIGLFVPQVALNRVRAPFPGTPSFVLLESRSHVIAIQFAAGVKLRDKVDVGLGVITLAVLHGGIHVATDAAGRFTTSSEQRLLTRFAPTAGARWHLRDDLDLGAVLRWVSRSDYDIDVTTDIGDVVPIQLPPIRIAGNAQYDPLTIAIEAAWRPRRGFLYAAQLQWQHWSGFPLPTENPVSGSPPQDEPGFHDTVVPRLGAEWTRAVGRAEVAVRAGAAFIMSPAPEASGRQSFLDNHRVVGSAGVGLALPRTSVPLYLDAWIQHHYLVPRRHTKDLDAFDPDEELPFDVVDTRGQIIVGGLTLGVAL